MTTTGRTRVSVLTAVCLLTALTGLTGCGTPRAPAVSLSPADTLKAAQLLLTDRCLTRQGLDPPRLGHSAAWAGRPMKGPGGPSPWPSVPGTV